jgi:hypothetical protein
LVIRKSSATDDIDPALLSCAERKRWENFQHRKKTVDAVLRLLEQEPHSNRLPAGSTWHARRIAPGGGLEAFRSRVGILEPYAETLDALWTGGRRNGAELWRRLRIRGFQGSLRVVAEWATRRRLDESSNPAGRVRKTPSARKIARSASEAMSLSAISCSSVAKAGSYWPMRCCWNAFRSAPAMPKASWSTGAAFAASASSEA